MECRDMTPPPGGSTTNVRRENKYLCLNAMLLHRLLRCRFRRWQAGNYSMSVKTAAGAHIYCGLSQEEACSPFEVGS